MIPSQLRASLGSTNNNCAPLRVMANNNRNNMDDDNNMEPTTPAAADGAKEEHDDPGQRANNWLSPPSPISPETTTVPSSQQILDWRNDKHGDWYCYWDESFGMPFDQIKDYVFFPPLEQTPTGFWMPPPLSHDNDGDGDETTITQIIQRDEEELRECFQSILQLCSKTPYIGWGDEGFGEWHPFLVSDWKDELTVERLLDRLGAHEKIRQPVQIFESLLIMGDDDDDDDDEEEDANNELTIMMQSFLNQYETVLIFHTGSDQLNPVPCFAVAQVRQDLVAGFIGGICHT